eukprot:m51a1_g6954 putative phosphoinositide 3kinase accessory domain (pik domain) domain containing protein (1277) ;mRNA; r:50317-55729
MGTKPQAAATPATTTDAGSSGAGPAKCGWLSDASCGGGRRYHAIAGGALWVFFSQPPDLSAPHRCSPTSVLPLVPGTRPSVVGNELRVAVPMVAQEFVARAASREEAREWCDAVVGAAGGAGGGRCAPPGPVACASASVAGRARAWIVVDGGAMSWYDAEESVRPRGEIALASARLEWRGPAELRVVASDPHAAIGSPSAAASADVAMPSRPKALKLYVALARAAAYANEIGSNLVPAAYREGSAIKVVVDVVLRGTRHSLSLPASMSPDAMMRRAMEHLVSVAEGPTPSLSIDLFALKLCGTDLYFTGFGRPLCEDRCFILLLRAFVLPRLCLAPRGAAERGGRYIQTTQFQTSAEELEDQDKISKIVGDCYLSAIVRSDLSKDESEVIVARKAFAQLRLDNEDVVRLDSMPEFIGNVNLAEKPPATLTVRMDLPHACGTTLLAISPYMTAKDLADLGMEKVATRGNERIAGYVLKIRGARSFMLGRRQIIDYDYVRKCVLEREEVVLSLVPVPDYVTRSVELRSKKNFLVDQVMASNLPDTPSPVSVYSSWDIKQPFRVKINCGSHLSTPRTEAIFKEKLLGRMKMYVYVYAELCHGGSQLCPPARTEVVATTQASKRGYKPGAIWSQWLSFNIYVCDIPRAARLCFTVFAKSDKRDREDVPVCWVSCLLYSHDNRLRSGPVKLSMWPDDYANPIGTLAENTFAERAEGSPPALDAEFENFKGSILFPNQPPYKKPLPDPSEEEKRMSIVRLEPLMPLLSQDALSPLTLEQRKKIWEARMELRLFPWALPKVLLSVDWANHSVVQEAHWLLDQWAPITPVQALQLLDWEFADSAVRSHAVRHLEPLSDAELSTYLNQLVLVLKYESHHCSPLARFLILRALRSKAAIGHWLFWHLRAEILHDPSCAIRYGLVLEGFVRGCGPERLEGFSRQIDVTAALSSVARTVRECRKDRRLDVLRNEITRMQLPPSFVLPLDPTVECSHIIVHDCRPLKSFLAPLYLVFKNSDSRVDNVHVIFKSGDDLRQDALTLQMMRIMDRLWCAEGMSLRLTLYNVVCTSPNEGMIEVVRNAETIGNILRESGSTAAVAVFQNDVLAQWLRTKAPNGDYDKAVENFTRSVAGYCVATYVLGIADRHNDNVMMCHDGRVLHIDFGHFLGHFLKKFGIEREKAPFFFTPQFVHILGGAGSARYQFFESLCVSALNAVRAHADVFLNLCMLLLSVGLPELRSVKDIMYLRDHLHLERNDTDAALVFLTLAHESQRTSRTQINDLFHMWAN